MQDGLTTVRGRVQSLVGSEALVEIEQGGCGRCHEEGGCGGQQLTQMFCGGPRHYRVANDIGAAVGELVTIGIADGVVRQSANLAYGLPLLALIVGALLGSWLADDTGAMFGGLLGLLLAFGAVRRRAQAGAGNSAHRPYIISRS